MTSISDFLIHEFSLLVEQAQLILFCVSQDNLFRLVHLKDICVTKIITFIKVSDIMEGL